MLKRLFVLCISLLPAFLLVSCGDGGSESGSEQSSTAGNQMSRYSDGDENQPEDSERLHGTVDQSRSAATSWPCIFSYDKGRRIYSSKIHHKSIARGNGGAWRVWARSTAGQAKIDAVKICNKYFKPCSTYDINGDVCGTTTFSISVPSGGERWKSGKKYTIKWSKGKAGATVKIQLLKSGKHYKWVAKKTKNDGKHVWKIPTKIATGSAYKIKITSTKNKENDR